VGVGQDFEAAARYFKMAADLGNQSAMNNYAVCLLSGKGVEPDATAAAQYWKMAADRGLVLGMLGYGFCLENGRGVQRDEAGAALYYKRSADEGDARAQFHYGASLERDRDYAAAAHYYKMSADGKYALGIWKYALCLRTGQGVEKDEFGADSYIRMLQGGRDREGLNALGNALRYGLGLPIDKVEAVRWYHKAGDLALVAALVNLGLCYERGEGVSADMVQAAWFYKLAADLGDKDAMLSVGLFHWCGLGGLARDQDEARRVWKLAGFDLGAPFVGRPDSSDLNHPTLLSLGKFGVGESTDSISGIQLQSVDSRRSSFVSDAHPDIPDLTLPERGSHPSVSQQVSAIGGSTGTSPFRRSSVSEHELESQATEGQAIGGKSAESPSVSETRIGRFQSVTVETDFELTPSFELWNADRLRSIESVVLFDGHQSVRDMLLSSHQPSASQLSVLIGEGIVREGNRCLHKPQDSSNGIIMYDELKGCSDIRSIFRLCVTFYTRATFLYRCVNKYLRETSNRDDETGRNIGIYIGIVRECFCVRSDLNPVEWRFPQKLYRGAKFPVGAVVDYARRQGEHIWWQGFTSASSDINIARRFEGNVMFEISVADSTPSLTECSAFPGEQEFILSPYQQFILDGVRWSDSLGRWTIQVVGAPSPNPDSWFVESSNPDGHAVPSTEDINH
jgi:TPR repeat protein